MEPFQLKNKNETTNKNNAINGFAFVESKTGRRRPTGWTTAYRLRGKPMGVSKLKS